MPRILVTGSAGLIGGSLCAALRLAGYEVQGFDLRAKAHEYGDVRDEASLRSAVIGCDGVIHLAAISRVLEAESAPEACHATNVRGVHNVLAAVEAGAGVGACMARRARSGTGSGGDPDAAGPWLVYASSREVYGNAASLPADEDSPLQPINCYAKSKVIGERLVEAAAARGTRTVITRFSNVYGSVDDYPDRVVPAFALAAAHGGRLVVRGCDQRLDFTHIDDVVQGLLRLVAVFGEGGVDVPTLHFVTGRGTSLRELAALSAEMAPGGCAIADAPESGIHVGRFIGCGARARRWLDWTPQIRIEAGLRRLIDDYVKGRSARANRAGNLAEKPAKEPVKKTVEPPVSRGPGRDAAA